MAFYWITSRSADGEPYEWCAVVRPAESWHERARIARFTPGVGTLTVDTEEVGVPGWRDVPVPFDGETRGDAEHALITAGYRAAADNQSGFVFRPL